MFNIKQINLIFRWFDFWIGLHWDTKNYVLYFFPIPMVGIKISFNNPKQIAKEKQAIRENVRRYTTDKNGMMSYTSEGLALDCLKDFFNWISKEEYDRQYNATFVEPQRIKVKLGKYSSIFHDYLDCISVTGEWLGRIDPFVDGQLDYEIYPYESLSDTWIECDGIKKFASYHTQGKVIVIGKELNNGQDN